MPTYGYQCTSCENAFEVVQKITDDPLVKCDVCGGELRKKIFPVGIQFKGSGFYVNDYAGGGAKDKPAPAVATDASSASSSETKSESPSTPAASADSKPADSPAPVTAPVASTKAEAS